MQLLTDVQEASKAENQKLLFHVREACRAESQEMQETNKKLLTEVQEISRAKNQKLFEASRTEKQKLLAESPRESEQVIEKMQATVLSKIGKELDATFGKLKEIHESFSKRINGVEKRPLTRKRAIWKRPSMENS